MKVQLVLALAALNVHLHLYSGTRTQLQIRACIDRMEGYIKAFGGLCVKLGII